MAIEVVFETHSMTEDNERGRATGWLPGRLSEQGRVLAFLGDLPLRWEGQRVLLIGHVATRWGLDHFIGGAALEDLAEQDFAWREGWEYLLS
jgi:hypothetical protein